MTEDLIGMTHLATCDLGGICRARAVPTADIGRWGHEGTGWVPASMAISPLGNLVEGNGFGAMGDLRLVPDLSTRCDLPSQADQPPVTLILGDLITTEGEPWDCSPRDFLRRAVADLRAETGLAVQAAFEHEFTLVSLPHVTPPLSLEALRRTHLFGSTLLTVLENAGLHPETWHPEYGPNQWEITLASTDAATAADRAILLREIVRHVAELLGHRVSFTPTPALDQVGNGVHVHLSLRSIDGSPATGDPAEPRKLSAEAASFAAGILRHSAALSALTAPSPVSALRFGPGHWSVTGARAAYSDREALVRICPPFALDGCQPADHLNLEYRGADATANPWLVLGALIRAGLDGIKTGLVLPDLAEPPQLSHTGEPMPSSLAASLDALVADPTALGWFPPALIQTYLTLKRDEISRTDSLNADERIALYTSIY